ncbi:hypothetical protein [Microbacterium saperdae]|uniref:Glycogen debranching enzyme n=1 Tax=Microbacterium saperdae TaxID=69368 RepID=A0A543BIW0_9MICO|nr:hypothetical protein [Microbacterium saperdae]TQL84755.1 hypothetical protein FB560_0347 [Microbacterium saperdae]GGM64310.1 hypothetical protein GCM10010489_39930 [Microbacterium saperdae]
MSWERSRSTKIYQQPPASHRLITVWPDLKVTDAPVGEDHPTPTGEHPQPIMADGLALAFGPDCLRLPWRDTQISFPEDRAPVAELEAWTPAGLDLAARLAVEPVAEPDWTWSIVLSNTSSLPVEERVWILVRSGDERLLMGVAWDGYCSYEPPLEHWGMVPAEELREGEESLGGRRLHLDVDDTVRRVHPDPRLLPTHARGAIVYDVRLTPGESTRITVGTAAADAESVAERQMSAWRDALAPASDAVLALESADQKIAWQLLAQNLQMLADYGREGLAPRQGGISRGIWPVEAIEMLRGLDVFGLGEWAAEGYRHLVSRQNEAGEVFALHAPQWAGNTGAFLAGVSIHLRSASDADPRLAAAALRAFEFIRDGRASVADEPGQRAGLFRSAQSTDWAGSAQNWMFTDALNVYGLREYARYCATHDVQRQGEVEDLVGEYQDVLRKMLDESVTWTAPGEALLSESVGMPPIDPPISPYGVTGPVTLLRTGIVDLHSLEIEGVLEYFRTRQLSRGGLLARMTDSLIIQGVPSDPWAGHTWYTTFAEAIWFDAALDSGDLDFARAIRDDLLRYAMSPEYQVAERYADNDPDFAPWQPNASGNGRILRLLAESHDAGL